MLCTRCIWSARGAAISSAALLVCFISSGICRERVTNCSLYTPYPPSVPTPSKFSEDPSVKIRRNPLAVVSCKMVSSSRARASLVFFLCAAFRACLLRGGVGGYRDKLGGAEFGVKDSMTLETLSCDNIMYWLDLKNGENAGPNTKKIDLSARRTT